MLLKLINKEQERSEWIKRCFQIMESAVQEINGVMGEDQQQLLVVGL